MQKLMYVVGILLLISCGKEQVQPEILKDTNKVSASHRGGHNGKKVDVCHYDADSDSWHVININVNALPAHLGHGDVVLEDADGDGWVEAENECVPGGDCDDMDASIHPGADDSCDDGIDNNCNGAVNEYCIDCCWAEKYPQAFGPASYIERLGAVTGNGCEPDFDIYTRICFDYCNVGACDEYLWVYGNESKYVCAYQSLDGVTGFFTIDISEEVAIACEQQMLAIAYDLAIPEGRNSICNLTFSCD